MSAESINSKTCILTFDIEEWFQVENLKGAIKRADWKSKKSSVEANTLKILDMLEKHQISATFFVLGWIAEKNPQLVRTIIDKGHEVACHGYEHDIAYSLENDVLYEDLQKSKRILEDISGQKVLGYRAPSFSISDQVLQNLKKLEFIYDSSYNPFRWNERYGRIKSKLTPLANGCYLTEHGLLEIPLSTTEFFNMILPVGGGAYFRIMPFFIFRLLVKSLLKSRGFYTFYLHPWELEPQQERIKNVKLNFKFRHYYGLDKTEFKFEKLISILRDAGCEFLRMDHYSKKIIKSESAFKNQ